MLLSPSFIYSSMKLIKSKQCLNLDLGNDLVKMFVGFSSDATFSTMISFVSIMSLTKCKRISMCFVLSWYTWWFAKWMTLWLSQCIFTHPWLIPISPIIPFNHMASLTLSKRAMYSAWVVERATTYCWFAFQVIVVPNNVNTNPDKDFLVSTLPG